MTEVYRTTSIDLNRTISDLTVKDFLKILPIYQICVDFSQYPPGPLNTPLLDTKKGVKFLTLPLGMIDEKQIPNNPIQRYLALYGTGTIQIETPPARQIDIYITNQGGNDLQVDFFDVSWNAVPPSQNVPAGGIGLVTCSGSNLCHAAIIVQSAECMISKVCFVHN